MKTKSAPQSALLNFRLLIGFGFCSVGASLALSGLGMDSAAPLRAFQDKEAPESVAEVELLQPWTVVANYPMMIESPAIGSDGTYAYSAGGFSGGASNAAYRYDPGANSWTALAVLPSALYATRGVYAANTNSFYVFGGYNGTALNSTYIYHVGTNSWTAGAVMPAVRSFPNIVYDGATGKIYVIGGFDSGFTEMNQTWEYDPVANTWDTSRANIPAAMAGSATSIVGRFIYLAGSWNGGGGSTLHYRYAINGNTWAPMPAVPVSIYEAAGAAIGSQIYLIGGGNPSVPGDGKTRAPEMATLRAPMAAYNSSYVFDTVALTWTSGPNTNVAHAFTGGTAISNRLLVVGGYDGTIDTNTVEMATAPSQGRRILIVQADCGTNPITLRNNLLALDPTLTVDFFNAQTGTPTLAQLQAYDIVVPFSNCSYSDPVTLGNNLVSYLNVGGVVVAFNFDWHSGNQSIQGTWLTGGYSPFNSPGVNNFSNGTLGTFTAGHPLMLGVNSLNSGFRMTMTLTSGATQVAAWNDGTPLMAYKGRAVGISGYVGDFSGGWSGDFARVILNAGSWLSSPGHHILLLQADCGTNPVTLRNNLLALEPTTTVDFFDGTTATPTLAQLQAYDTVVPFSNCNWFDSTALGNNLVSYMNAGGVVVAFNFDWSSVGTSSIQGTWVSGGYTPFSYPAPNAFSNGTLGTFTAGHPLMEGVSSLNSFFRSMATVAPGATQVAAWNDSTPLLAYKGHAVGLSGYVGDASDNWTGDYARVILNAGNWLGASDLFASLNGQVSIGNGGGSILEFTSAGGKSTFASTISRPRGLAFDAAGNLFVGSATFDSGTGSYQSTILKITPLGLSSTFATLSGNMFAEDLKFDNAGNLFVFANDQSNPDVLASTIYKFTPGGTQSVFGSTPGQSFGLAFSSAGDLYASDALDQTIYKYTPAGARTVFIPPAAFAPPGLQNGGFETSSFSPGWTVMSSSPAPVVSNLQANFGTYSGHVGSFPPGEVAGDSSFFQQVTISPVGGKLTYLYWPRTLDTIASDWQDAYITNAAGTVILATVMHVCENTQDWVPVTYDMSAFAGQTVGIKFLVHGDGAGGDPTDMFVDDVYVTRASPIGLAFDKAGNLFVSTESATVGVDTILKFTPAGVKSTFASGLNNPRGMAFDSMGNLFVAEVPQFSTGDILKFTPAGAQSVFATALGRPAGNGGPEFLTFQPITPLGVVSRKIHGIAGAFDVPLPLSGTPGIECRSGGATNDYQIIVAFAHNVTVGGTPEAQVTSGTGTVGTGGVANGGVVSVSGSTVTVPLTNIANAQTITVTLFGVNDGSSSGNVVIPMSRLLGDTNANGAVSSADVSQTKSRIGQAVSTANFRSDVSVNGSINATDSSIVKSSVGTALP